MFFIQNSNLTAVLYFYLLNLATSLIATLFHKRLSTNLDAKSSLSSFLATWVGRGGQGKGMTDLLKNIGLKPSAGGKISVVTKCSELVFDSLKK